MIVEDGDIVAVQSAATTGCYRLKIRCPEIARRIRPGQFVMVRLTSRPFPFLGRPLSIADVDPSAPGEIELVFVAVGEGTRALAGAEPGDAVRTVGPLGNGFFVEPAPEHVLIAGGIGVAPFPFLAREIARQDPGSRCLCLLGAGRADELHLAGRLAELGVAVETATLDGSHGRRGTVVDLFAARGVSTESRLYACGPQPMLAALARHLAPAGRACQAALEERMGCGFGACNGCVTPVKDGSAEPDGWHYELVCLHGPVFDLHAIRWDAAAAACSSPSTAADP